MEGAILDAYLQLRPWNMTTTVFFDDIESARDALMSNFGEFLVDEKDAD
jgi:hypothetical protein